jgi:hypothetical protein
MEYRTTIDLTQVTDLQALPLELDADVYPTMNSFRLRFKHDEFIDFYADNEEDFAKWTSTLRHVLRNMPNFEAPNDEDPAETNCGQPTGYHEEAGLAQNVARAIERKPALKQSSIGFPVESRAALLDALKSDGSDSSDSDVDYKVSEGHLRQIENTDRVHKVVMHGIPAFGQTVPRKAPIAQHVGVFGSRH